MTLRGIHGVVFLVAGVSIFLSNDRIALAQEPAGETLRDPFVSFLDLERENSQRKISKNMDLSQFELKGIIWNQKFSVAIINDELFVTGDPCKGLKIQAIEKEGVILTDGTDSFKISLLDKIVPKARESRSPTEGPALSSDSTPQELRSF
jgi:hypothetical protein